jgi:glutathionylspermidine synthase
MIRQTHAPRSDWQQQVEQLGFDFHTLDGEIYWDESASYELSLSEVETLEAAANEVHARCVDAAEHLLEKGRLAEMGIPKAAIAEIQASWNRDDPSLYGRFDFAWDGVHPPKLLEYNADTPTALFEASVVQWQWLQQCREGRDQFNSIHERLIAGWKEVSAKKVHFASSAESPEDATTTLYLRDTANQAGKQTVQCGMGDIGWDEPRQCFVVRNGGVVEKLFKLYPWEWMWQEDFGRLLPGRCERFMEPVWKMMWSTKALLPVLTELFPSHPNLAPAYRQPEPLRGRFVKKPILGREGSNVTWTEHGSTVAATDGPYGGEGFVYQEPAPLACFDGNWPIFGVWMIGGEAAGLGIREDRSRITSNASRFVPHYF